MAQVLINNNQLKLKKTPVMKTLKNKFSVKLISVFTLSFVLISTTLLSQVNFDLSEDYNEKEIPVQEWMCTTDLNSEDMLSENYSEEPIELQEWMVSTELSTSLIAEDYNEEEIQFQDWMVNTDPIVDTYNEVKEPLMAIQEWMVDYNAFALQVDFDYLLSDAEEAPIEIDVWMKSYDIFSQKSLTPLVSKQSINFNETPPVFIALQDK